MRLTGEELLKRFKKAKAGRSPWEDLWQDIYDYTMPSREGFYETTPGEERAQQIFDETALVALGDFVSRIQQGVIPSHLMWFRLEPGPEITDPKQRKELQAQLDIVTRFIWEAIVNSNFANEAQEVLTDIAVGWSTLIIDDGIDGKLLSFKCIPQCQTFWDVGGPNREPDGVFRVREKIKIADIKTIWPDAIVSDMLKGKLKGDPDATTNLVEANYRDWKDLRTPVYRYQVVAGADKSLILDNEERGLGARPYITARWAVAAGETYGRGPLVSALPAIRTTNLVTEMILENSQMAISGLWQVDDDGTINVDNVEIVPGAVYARPPDGRGLERTDSPSNFNVADIILSSQQENIRKALFSQNLGPVDQTPRSATEINARMQDLAEQTAGPSSRLKAEWLDKMIQRIVWLFTRSGILEMPQVDGRSVRVVAKSPLARAQKFEEIERIRGFAGDVIGMVGPQGGQLYLNHDVLVEELQSKWEVPQNLVRPQAAREKLMRDMAEAASSQQAGGLPAQAQIGQ
ncbi:MAG: hypothetical protein E4G91_08320 [Candidatus Zixiibacteriota bacterium]|nr:MAG: hypothetical protein E4G91_08320 [candidate division Zixibacteria bacterium]